MNLPLTVVLQIAQGIERKGIEVYQRMKTRFSDPLLDLLIQQEQAHIRVFQELFEMSRTGPLADGLETAHLDADYLTAAYANAEIFGHVDPTRVPPEGLFALAVSMEKESIRFYLELLAELPERCQEQCTLVRRLADEERQHLRSLLAKRDVFAAR